MGHTINSNRFATMCCALFTTTALLASSNAGAETGPGAMAIEEAVSDHSYQGSMSEANSAFNEYYAPDGTIHGANYTGKWSVKDSEMCFAYGEAPTCYQVTIDGPSMVLRLDGAIKGNGMLVQGNTVK